jgi:benzoyl-CoA reductase subunit C
MEEIFAAFAKVAAQPLEYARQWKAANGGRVIGIFPMHFPGELAHAAGALPVILQEDDKPITVGLSSVFNFYCGYNRSVTDQAMRGEYDFLDAILFGDHCVQLLGTADVLRSHMPNLPILFNQLISTLDAPWAVEETQGTFRQLWTELEELTGSKIPDAAVQASVRLFNKNRALIRELYSLRRAGKIALTGRQLQHVVKSSMIMDKATHTEMLERLVAQVKRQSPATAAVRVYLSGHLCQAPKLEILDLIEECGGIVVDDDLYHGFRYISTDMDETAPPLDALTSWYLERNRKVPCPTRPDKNLDWEAFLLSAVEKSRAQGLIVLMAKFCEPHMFFYPEIKEAFEERGIPHLLVETEHESMPIESLKTRVEAFLEVTKRRAAA